MKYEVGFIGVGNMGGALCRAITKKTEAAAVYDVNTAAAERIAKECGCEVCDLDTIAAESRFLFLGVKPNVIQSVCASIAGKAGGTVVSMAAGTALADLCGWLGTDNVIRIMPNTPAAVGQGMILYTCGAGVSAEDAFLAMMEPCGMTDKIDEKLIDAAAALSGCGPAYVYLFIEALADGAVSRGVPRAKAELYAKQTILGAASLALQSNKHPGKLKDEVCSPGGTTIEGVLALENGAFRATVASAVTAACDKTAKLR